MTIDVANGIATSGNAVVAENASMLAIATAPPARPREHVKSLSSVEHLKNYAIDRAVGESSRPANYSLLPLTALRRE